VDSLVLFVRVVVEPAEFAQDYPRRAPNPVADPGFSPDTQEIRKILMKSLLRFEGILRYTYDVDNKALQTTKGGI
jgi:hypothetical protein